MERVFLGKGMKNILGSNRFIMNCFKIHTTYLDLHVNVMFVEQYISKGDRTYKTDIKPSNDLPGIRFHTSS